MCRVSGHVRQEFMVMYLSVWRKVQVSTLDEKPLSEVSGTLMLTLIDWKAHSLFLEG